MNITIIGAGNIGTQIATHCAFKSHSVTMFTSKYNLVSKTLNIVNELGETTLSGDIACATDDAKLAFGDADLVFITVPAFHMQKTAKTLLPYIKAGAKICLVPGSGGGEFAFKECIDKGCVLFGLQRVPCIARLVEYGKTVCATGYKDELFVASIPTSYTKECADIISGIFDMKCSVMPNYLNVTLTPSNPILHTTRLRTLFKDYYEGFVYPNVPLFYEEWCDESSELLFYCDSEVQNICKAFDEFDLSYVKPLKLHYESETPEQLTRKITSIKSFKGLKSPCVEVEGGYIPDFSSRYFTADFPYGLSILVQLSKLLGLDCPYMQATLDWYYSVASKTNEFSFADYNIKSLAELVEFYKQ